MRVANLDGRLVLVTDDGVVDVERVSEGRFGHNVAAVYGCWEEFQAWARVAIEPADAEGYDRAMLQAPSPAPRQVFAVGLNYATHVDEAGLCFRGRRWCSPSSHPALLARTKMLSCPAAMWTGKSSSSW